ncbi:MAG: CPBP family intramembrane glutamic endopeptidase [Planctomycetota bacterium]
MLMVGVFSPREADLSRLFYGTARAGFFEEWLFRAFAFGLLVQIARWRVWPAAVFTGAVFGLIHLNRYTIEALWSGAGGLAFIGLGGVLYAWLYWRWQWNLWIVIGLHTFMNLWWGLWDLHENALGGWAVTASRVLAVGGAITITEIARKRPGLGERLGVHTMPR